MPTRRIPLRRSAWALLMVLALPAAAIGFWWDDMSRGWRAVVMAAATVIGALVVVLRREPSRASTATPLPDPRVDVIDLVLADGTRRPWEPTTLPWLPQPAGPKPVLLLAGADYHLAELIPLARALESRGLATRFSVGPSPWSRTWPAVAAAGLEVHEVPSGDRMGDLSAVVTLKDTGSHAPVIEEAASRGIPTFGKVEGVQDFWDTDTPHERRPYRLVDHVLCQGGNDAEALGDRPHSIVGSSRLEDLWLAPPMERREPLAVINLNFVYGVRSDARRAWLESAVAACEQSGVPFVISIHPAERARHPHPRATSISASRLLEHATVLISRFSTVPFEAMARGVPFVYHNPHGEKVPTFADPRGAFDIARSVDDLVGALGGLPTPGEETRGRVEEFFLAQVDVDPTAPSSVRAAGVIAGQLT